MGAGHYPHSIVMPGAAQPSPGIHVFSQLDQLRLMVSLSNHEVDGPRRLILRQAQDEERKARIWLNGFPGSAFGSPGNDE